MLYADKINIRFRFWLLVIGFLFIYAGFMIKLPYVFRHIDKELHSAFYFFAAFVLCWLFEVKKIKINILIAASLFIFGVFVELSQHFSNYLLHKRIHGRFDVVDIKYNLFGILLFLVVFLIIKALKRL